LRGDDHFGPAAEEAVQQRLGSDVDVKQSRRTSQLGQTEPSPHVAGLVGQKQGDRVPLLQPGFNLQRARHLVALLVHVSISILASFKVHEDLPGMLLRGVQEAVQDAVERFARLVLEEPEAELQAGQDVGAVLSEVRPQGPQQREGQQRQSRDHREQNVHVAARAGGRWASVREEPSVMQRSEMCE